jgi:hypothetical protein
MGLTLKWITRRKRAYHLTSIMPHLLFPCQYIFIICCHFAHKGHRMKCDLHTNTYHIVKQRKKNVTKFYFFWGCYLQWLLILHLQNWSEVSILWNLRFPKGPKLCTSLCLTKSWPFMINGYWEFKKYMTNTCRIHHKVNISKNFTITYWCTAQGFANKQTWVWKSVFTHHIHQI